MNANKKALPNYARDALVSVLIFLAAFGLCCLLSRLHDDNNPFASQVFTLAVLLISYWTRSYIPGIVCSVLGVICVNVFFTYPFYHFNMTGVGYPLTFLVMLAVSILVSTLPPGSAGKSSFTLRRRQRGYAADCCGQFPTICARPSPASWAAAMRF